MPRRTVFVLLAIIVLLAIVPVTTHASWFRTPPATAAAPSAGKQPRQKLLEYLRGCLRFCCGCERKAKTTKPIPQNRAMDPDAQFAVSIERLEEYPPDLPIPPIPPNQPHPLNPVRPASVHAQNSGQSSESSSLHMHITPPMNAVKAPRVSVPIPTSPARVHPPANRKAASAPTPRATPMTTQDLGKMLPPDVIVAGSNIARAILAVYKDPLPSLARNINNVLEGVDVSGDAACSKSGGALLCFHMEYEAVGLNTMLYAEWLLKQASQALLKSRSGRNGGGKLAATAPSLPFTYIYYEQAGKFVRWSEGSSLSPSSTWQLRYGDDCSSVKLGKKRRTAGKCVILQLGYEPDGRGGLSGSGGITRYGLFGE